MKFTNHRFGYWFDVDGGWVRFNRLCLLWKHRRNEPLFSERNGYRRHYRIPFTPWRVRLELW